MTNTNTEQAATTVADQHEEAIEQGVEELVQGTRDKITHLLGMYPYVSRAMIQTGLGPACPPTLWDPILKDLVQKGEILVFEGSFNQPGGRALTRQVYHLPTFPYPPVTQAQLKELQTPVLEQAIEVAAAAAAK